MVKPETNFHNILVIDLGQLGDVVQSLPALQAIRRRFPDARITALVGKVPSEVVRLTDAIDDIVEVDRVRLRKSPKLWSIMQIFRLVGVVRKRKFDFVIDLHSLYETNILGFLSGARHRLYANRENRSLDYLANFRPKPPMEDKTIHISKRYLDVLEPLGVEGSDNVVLRPPRSDVEFVDRIWTENKFSELHDLIGLFPGAGHPSRCWSLENFAELSKRLFQRQFGVAVFLGPEEAGLSVTIRAMFPPETRIIERLTITQFVAAASRLSAFIANDTGPLHLASAADVPVLGLFDSRAPMIYKPLTDKLSVVNSGPIEEIAVEEVLEATLKLLERTCGQQENVQPDKNREMQLTEKST